MNKLKGLLWGMLSGGSFGLIPLFTLPLLASGFNADSILFYRFSFAAAIIGAILLVRRESFKITKEQLTSLLVLGFLYMCSSMLLLWGYEFMAAGVATTVHFLYPVCTVLIMMFFFGERASLANIGAVILAILGVALLGSGDGSGDSTSVKGLIIVILSALAYALYIVGLRKLRLGKLGVFVLTFYVLTIAALIFLIKGTLSNTILPLSGGFDVINIMLLALIPTVISNFALVNAVKIVGSTTSSILGALEPLTAVVLGVTVFDEPMSMIIVVGIALIIAAVAAIIQNREVKN